MLLGLYVPGFRPKYDVVELLDDWLRTFPLLGLHLNLENERRYSISS
jgi:hypothetical protein